MHDLANREVTDRDFEFIETSSVTDAYARVLLLATAKPNQLRQQEIALVYRATETWSALIEIKPAGEDADLFVFDLQMDRPPTYRTHASVATGQTRYIDSRLLVGKLAQALGGQRTEEFDVPVGMADYLLEHLQRRWDALPRRALKALNRASPHHII